MRAGCGGKRIGLPDVTFNIYNYDPNQIVIQGLITDVVTSNVRSRTLPTKLASAF